MISWLFKPFISLLLKEAVRKLQKAGNSFEYKRDRLQTSLQGFQQFIENAEVVNVNYLLLAEKIACKAVDLVDDIYILDSRRSGWFHKPLDSVKGFLLKRKMTTIQSNLDDLINEIEKFFSLKPSKGDNTHFTETKRQTTSSIRSDLVGRKQDLQNLTTMFDEVDKSSTASGVSITPIVGMIGVGKTALAQHLYHNDPINLKIWVSVQGRSDASSLLKLTIQNARLKYTNGLSAYQPLQQIMLSQPDSTLESLQQTLKEILRGKKFLLVLDDLQDMSRDEWRHLLEPLTEGSKGSKIIITTGNDTFSNQVRTTEQYHLKRLSDSDCLSLISRKALGKIRNEDLETVGMKLARRCKGLPFVAESIGERLSSPSNTNERENILEGKIWASPGIRNDTHPFVICGYSHLSPVLRQCIAFCSMYPQGHIYDKAKISKVWKAQELTESWEYETDLFEQLRSNVFFETDGKNYIINDFLHELVQSVSAAKFLRLDGSDSLENKSPTHISVLSGDIEPLISKASKECKGLRTVLLVGAYENGISRLPFDLFLLESLRVLDLSGTSLEKLVVDIANLAHLRFLDLSNTLLVNIPEVIQKLYVLQTLRLINCRNLLCLPTKIRKCKSLLHLELDGRNKMSYMPLGIGKLTELQTLNVFIVGDKRSKLKELENMNKIQGSLCIKQLDKVKNRKEATEAKLAEKEGINVLELQWSTAVEAHMAKDILERLIAPSKSLGRLTLRKYGGEEFPDWVSSPMFSKLTSIVLYECINCKTLPALGNFPALKSLKIEDMPELEKVEQSFLGNEPRFRSLETLEFSYMPKLEKWCEIGEGDMECIRELSFCQCPLMASLDSLHNLKTLKKLELHDCPELSFVPMEILSSADLIKSGCQKLDERISLLSR